MNKLTRQGVKDLNHLKGTPRGIRLSLPPTEADLCQHPVEAIEYDSLSGISKCKCGRHFDFDGNPI